MRADTAAGPASIEAALRASSQLRSWLASSDAALTARLAAQVSFPEKTIADCTRSTLNEAARSKERSDTLGKIPSLADALDHASVTPGHVDAVTKATKSLDHDEQRTELFDRVSGLIDVATAATVEEFRRRLAIEVKNIQRDDGIDRLERQRRATRLRSWVDSDGMWRFDGRFDPVTGVGLAARLDAAVQALFAEAVPDTSPTDPIEKQHHLRALAFARLLSERDGVGAGRPGRPEYVVVIDSSQPDGVGGPAIDWGIPVEVPARVLADMCGDGDLHTVVVRNGVVVHAPGELDLGRSTRLANRAQRRALRALYSGCAIPGCSVRYDRCRLHHVVWWRNGGRTDLHNLVPLCTHHHTKVHSDGWTLAMGAHRDTLDPFPRRHHPQHRPTPPPSRLNRRAAAPIRRCLHESLQLQNCCTLIRFEMGRSHVQRRRARLDRRGWSHPAASPVRPTQRCPFPQPAASSVAPTQRCPFPHSSTSAWPQRRRNSSTSGRPLRALQAVTVTPFQKATRSLISAAASLGAG